MGHQVLICDRTRESQAQGFYVAPVVTLPVPVEAVRRPVCKRLKVHVEWNDTLVREMNEEVQEVWIMCDERV
jgi:hypothetical protein